MYAAVGGGIAYGLARGYSWLALHELLPSVVRRPSPWFLPVAGGLPLIGFGFATWLVGTRFAACSWERLGWRAGGGRQLLRGLGLGAGASISAVLLTVAFGGASVHLVQGVSLDPGLVLPLALGLLAAALFEELVFRGFPLRRLADALGPWPATLLLGCAFGIAHAWNDHVGAFALVNIALAGVWLSVAFFSAGMWLAWGVHFGWNFGLALLHAPVSGIDLGLPDVLYRWGPHSWLDGGAFGPEGGMVGTIGITLGVLGVLGSRVGRPRAWLTA